MSKLKPILDMLGKEGISVSQTSIFMQIYFVVGTVYVVLVYMSAPDENGIGSLEKSLEIQIGTCGVFGKLKSFWSKFWCQKIHHT